MEKKRIILTVYLIVFTCIVYAQRIDVQQVLIATSEEEVYKRYDQMLDSARLSNRFLSPSGGVVYDDYFAFGYFYEITSKDTVMKFVQECSWQRNDEYICERFYRSYISNSMPIDFYERFLTYLKQLDRIENYFIKQYSTNPLYAIKNILIKQYESGNLNKEDSIKARRLIEETILRLVNDEHNYRGMISYHKYITDTIRQALVNVIENPFYPTEYLNFYMSQQDTTFLDTTGIPANIRLVWKEHFTPEELQTYEKERPLYIRLERFRTYERIGKKEYNGLSAGQAYLRRKKEKFREKGYLQINYIEEYAYQKQDKLLIEHLKAFKKKHLEEFNKQYPYYPLKY